MLLLLSEYIVRCCVDFEGLPSNVALLALRPAAVDQSPCTVNRGSIG